MKPTKQQVKEAIAMFAECPMSAIKYDYNKKEFSYFEMIPIPHYDSGGGIDAMDYNEIPRTTPWKEAVKTFRYYKNLLKINFKYRTPVEPIDSDDFQLPF